MFDVITLGTATRDTFIKVDNLKSKNNYLLLEEGKKIEISKPFVQTGGGATNTAVSFARLGLDTAIISKLGKDEAGYLIKSSLVKEGVNIEAVVHDTKEGTARSTILVKNGKDATVLVYRGASSNLNIKEIKLNELDTKWIYISALKGESVKILHPILEHCKRKGIKIAINPGSKELDMPFILKYADILLLNLNEAKKFSGKNEIKDILKKFKNEGIKIAAITSGKNPVNVLYYNKVLTAKPIDVRVVSTIGAGDAFCSGFVYSLIKNKSIDYAIRSGLLNSASVVQHFGAKVGLLKLHELKRHERSLNKIHVRSFEL